MSSLPDDQVLKISDFLFCFLFRLSIVTQKSWNCARVYSRVKKSQYLLLLPVIENWSVRFMANSKHIPPTCIYTKTAETMLLQ